MVLVYIDRIGVWTTKKRSSRSADELARSHKPAEQQVSSDLEQPLCPEVHHPTRPQGEAHPTAVAGRELEMSGVIQIQ